MALGSLEQEAVEEAELQEVSMLLALA